MNNGLLEGGNNARMDSSVHKAILNDVETVSKNVIISHDTHVTCDGCWCLICVSGWQREEVSQLSFSLLVYVSI